MPDRNRHQPDPPTEDYTGEERRKPTGTEVHRAIGAAAGAGSAAALAVQTSREPEWQREWPSWAKMLWHLGPFSIICLGLITVGSCAIRERESDRQFDRQDRLEERELRRAEQAQHARDSAALVSKFDALIAKVDASMDRVTAAGNEVRTTRVSMEQIVVKLEDVMQRLFAELKRFTPAPRKSPPMGPDKPVGVDAGEVGAGFFNPIWGLIDHAPPVTMPEPAPMPRIIPRLEGEGVTR